MGIIAALIGLPVTAILLAIGVVFILLGTYIYKKVENKFLKNVSLFLSCLPISIVCALYFGRIFTAIIYWCKQGFDGFLEILFTPALAMLVGTLNVLEPGAIMMGDNGPTINTEQLTTIFFWISLVVSVFFVFRYNRKH